MSTKHGVLTTDQVINMNMTLFKKGEIIQWYTCMYHVYTGRSVKKGETIHHVYRTVKISQFDDTWRHEIIQWYHMCRSVLKRGNCSLIMTLKRRTFNGICVELYKNLRAAIKNIICCEKYHSSNQTDTVLFKECNAWYTDKQTSL